MPALYNRMPDARLNAHLENLRLPIGDALDQYLSGTGLSLDIRSARKLAVTPTRPNSARSETALMLGKESLGNLFVIAFQAGDGTGDEQHGYTRNGIHALTYTNTTHIVPREKTGLHSEVHLPLLAQWVRDGDLEEPDMLHGRLDLLGLSDKEVDGKPEVVTLGLLGHPYGPKGTQKVATYTLKTTELPDGTLQREGDPHAVYDSMPYSLQIAAFFALKDAIAENYPGLLEEAFHPQDPIRL